MAIADEIYPEVKPAVTPSPEAAAAASAGKAAASASTAASMAGAAQQKAQSITEGAASTVAAAVPPPINPQAAAAASAGKAAASASDAASKAGQDQQKAQSITEGAASSAAAEKAGDPTYTIRQPPTAVTTTEPAKAEGKKSKTAKEVSDQSMDLLSSGLDFIKNMAEGGDPTIQANFNSWLNKFATSNASARSALMMNLRSQPGFVAGSGEGTAAMLMMARGTNTTLADMVSKMEIANVQFMMDANKLGIDKAIEVRRFINDNETHDLQNQISELNIESSKQQILQNNQTLLKGELDTLKDYGQYDKIAEILNKKYPGLAVSSATIRSADPVTLNAMSGQKASIAALVESGNAEAAKEQAIGYYSQFWQNEGFKSQEEAIAYANKLDFSAAAFTARTKFIEASSTAVRNYAVSNNSSAGKAAVIDN